MKRTINRGEKIMKGRFFTLIVGLLIAGSAMAQGNPTTGTITGNIPVNITTKGMNITLPDMNFDLSKQNKGAGTATSVYCGTKIPAVELGNLFLTAHKVNKYTQLRTNENVMNYLTTMGIYNGTVANVNFNGKGGVTGWTTSQYTPGYWGTQNAMVDVYNNNPWLLMAGGMGGMGGSNWGGYSAIGGYMAAANYNRF